MIGTASLGRKVAHRRRSLTSAAVAAVTAVAVLAGTAYGAVSNTRVTSEAENQFAKPSSMASAPLNQQNVIVAFAEDRNPKAQGQLTCYLALNTHGGTGGWAIRQVVGAGAANPLPNGVIPPQGTPGCQSPTARYSRDGATIYYAFQAPVTVTGRGGRYDYGFIYFTKSTDGGVTWTAPLKVNADNPYDTTRMGGDTGGDWYPDITVDTTGGPANGRLYVSWKHYQHGFRGGFVAAAFSTDGGASFSSSCGTCVSTHVVNPPQTNESSGMTASGGGGQPGAVALNGRFCVAFGDQTETQATRGGTGPDAEVACVPGPDPTANFTFNPPVQLGKISQTCTDFPTSFGCGPISPSIHIASGPCPAGPTCSAAAGQMAVTWSNTEKSEIPDGGRLYEVTSADGGATWPTVSSSNVAQVTAGDIQYFPNLAIAPNGRLDLNYYDVRPTATCPTPADATAGVRNTYHVSSLTLGADLATKVPTLESTACSDSNIKPAAQVFGGPVPGLVVGVATPTSALLAWSDTRNSISETTGRYQMFSANDTSP
ncbi:MAG: glycoside hydrolase [Actinomycetota bacterium]|nr:glycoside hydrolase [Actinomycetota bacterium]